MTSPLLSGSSLSQTIRIGKLSIAEFREPCLMMEVEPGNYDLGCWAQAAFVGVPEGPVPTIQRVAEDLSLQTHMALIFT